MVSTLDSGSRGPGLSPGLVIVLCSWARHFTLTVPLSSQEYKWVPANCQGNLQIGVLLLLLDGMLVHHRLPPNIWSGFPDCLLVPSYTPGSLERGTVNTTQ